MTERDALLAAVVADPDNDLPRLVYANWCDDHGDPDRAEFIRVQIASAGRPGVRWPVDRWVVAKAVGDSRRLTLREQGKAEARMQTWYAELPQPSQVAAW